MDIHPPGGVSPEPGLARAESTPSGHNLLRAGLWVLIVAALCVVALWRFNRGTAPNDDPLASAIEALGAATPSERIAAVRQVGQVGMADLGRSIPPMVKALGEGES